jgi:hypothetical protein
MMARYSFQPEGAETFETKDTVVILEAKRAITSGGNTAGYLLMLLVEHPNGMIAKIEMFAKSQGSANHYLANPFGWFIFKTVHVGDTMQLWQRGEYAMVREIVA